VRVDPVQPGHEAAAATEIHYHAHHRVASVPWLYQHNYAHWTRVALPEGRWDLANLERIPGVLPFEIYAQAPLRLISWCSFELTQAARRLLRDLRFCAKTKDHHKNWWTRLPCETHRSRTNKRLRSISQRLPQCTSHPELKCPHTRQWSSTS